MAIQYPLAKPNIGLEEERAVTEVLTSGILSIGPKVIEFERQLAKKLKVKYACAVSSGTAGLHLALIAAGIRAGDEVITTPFSFVASANSILYVGAKPVFVDINPFTYNLDHSKIEEKITPKTKAILVVHIFGQPSEMSQIVKIAHKHKLKIIEDACEAISAQHRGIMIGGFGEVAVLAFYPNKQITTGEGGMVITNNKRIYNLCCSLRNQGRSPDMRWLDHERLGYNYRMDEMSATLGLAQLKKLDFVIKERRKIASWYTKYLFQHGDIIQTPQIAEGNTHTWFVYVIKILNKEVLRDEIIKKLQNSGISTKPYLPSIHLFSFYKNKYGYKKGDFPVSEEVSNYSLAIPFYIGLREKDVIYIVDKIVSLIRSCHKKKENKKVLVIGGTGFIGSYVVKKLVQRKNVQIGVIHKKKVSLKDRTPGVGYTRLDLSHPTQILKSILSGFDCLVILTRPDRRIIRNLLDNIVLSHSQRKIIYLSTVLLYPHAAWRQSEESILRPTVKYERGKLKEELLLSSFVRSKKRVKLCIARMTNVYGDVKNRGVVAQIISAIIHNKPFVIDGNGDQKRDYIFVEDAASLIEFLIFIPQKKELEIFNVSNRRAYTVNELVEKVERVFGRKIVKKFGPPKSEKKSIILDNSRIIKKSNYKFQYNLWRGLQKTRDNYLRHLNPD